MGKLSMVFILLISATLAHADLSVGKKLTAFRLVDQRNNSQSVDGKVKKLIFARDQESSKIAADAMMGLSADQMEKLHTVYVADVSGMPGFVLDMFAMPKMKTYPYAVLLGRDVGQTQELPSKPGNETLIKLNNLQVESIRYFSSVNELRQAIQ